MHFYTWEVIYLDGSKLDERDGHTWANVDTSQVQYLIILNAVGIAILSAAVPSGTIPEFFRRHTDGGDTTTVGWPGAYVWFLDSGTMALTAIKDEV